MPPSPLVPGVLSPLRWAGAVAPDLSPHGQPLTGGAWWSPAWPPPSSPYPFAFSLFHPAPLSPPRCPPSFSALKTPPSTCINAGFSRLGLWQQVRLPRLRATAAPPRPVINRPPFLAAPPLAACARIPLALPGAARAAACRAPGLPAPLSKDTWVRGRAARGFRELSELGKKPARLFPRCLPPRDSRVRPRRWHAASPPRSTPPLQRPRTSPGAAGSCREGRLGWGPRCLGWALAWGHARGAGGGRRGRGGGRGGQEGARAEPRSPRAAGCDALPGPGDAHFFPTPSLPPSPRGKRCFWRRMKGKLGNTRCANSVSEPRNMKRPFGFFEPLSSTIWLFVSPCM